MTPHGRRIDRSPDASRLALWLSNILAADVDLIGDSISSEGGVQENRVISCLVDEKERQFVVRQDHPAQTAEGLSHGDEFAVLKAAYDAGIRVPQPIGFCDDPAILGFPFSIVTKVDGIAVGSRVVNDASLGGNRDDLARDLGRQLALIHGIRPPRDDLSFLGQPSANPLRSEVERLRGTLDILGVERPVLEWGLAQVLDADVSHSAVCLTHRDFRTGSYLIDGNGLAAILNWQFAGWGDPMADLGWFCAECWRFGRRDLDAGGIASRAALYEGYTSSGGCKVDGTAVRAWEILAHLRWAVICLQKGVRHLSGVEPSLELALASRAVREAELAIISATAPGWMN